MIDDEPPVDLSALDPTLPPAAFERRLAAIHEATRHIAARRRAGGTPLLVVARWRAPLLAAVFLVMIASAAILRSTVADAGAVTDARDDIAEVLGLSTTFGATLLSDSASPEDLLLGGYEQ